MLCLLVSAALSAQESVNAERYKSATDKLHSITSVNLSDCRLHADVRHPEDVSLDDSDWPVLKMGDRLRSGVQVLRCWESVPEKLNGYDLRGATLKAVFEFEGDGLTTVTVFSNGYNLYHGDADVLEPVLLTANAQPGQRILVAVRMDVGDQPRRWSRSEILIEPAAGRPDADTLRWEILSALPIVNAYPDAVRQRQLDAAIGAIDFSTLDRGDQQGFDAALRQAQMKLEVLQPWMRHFRIRAVGNSHIDMAWLWPWTETVEMARKTFRSALDMMQEYPAFKFSASSARVFEWMEEKYPAMFQEIQQRVKEGRWEIVGGMWVEPDLNMPGGESLTRQILIGKRYFREKFGVDVKVGWNPDSFGYSWQLPQIYKKSGIDYFVTQKLLWAHEFTTFPYKLFWWQAPDGSRLLTYFPHDYGGSIDPVVMANDVSVWMPAIYGKQAAAPLMMYLYGVGDHGGGPTRTMLDTAGRLMKEDAVFPKLEFSTSAAFFADVEKKMPELHVPTWSNELYFQHHRGVFTTQAETKTRIRHTEETLLDAEKYASIAELYGQSYPKEKLRTAWKGLLFDQFHDIMPGSGIAANYVDAQRDLENVERTGNAIRRESLNEISARIDTHHEGVPVVVYNSLSWPRTEVIDVSVQMPTPVREIEVVDSRGKIAPAQVVGDDAATHRLRLLLQARVPALGYETYFVREARQIEASAPSGAEVKATPSRLENEFVRVEVDSQTGCITSLFDKRSKREALAKSESDTGGPADKVCGNLLQTFADNPKEYDAWNIDADFEKQHWDLDKADDVKLAEAGPLRAVIRVKHHFQNSTFVQDITLYAGVPRVDVKMQTEWREKHILLKVGFPVSVHSKTATFEIPYGAIERPTTRATPEEQAQFEVPAQHWADLSDEQHGLSLLNNCKYGYDAKANVLRLSLLRSPAWPDPHADEGHHEFTYSVYAHGGTWREADTVRRGYELNYNLIATQVQNHTGDLAPSHSFLQIAGGNVVLTAMKWAEDRDAMILRFYEWAGSEADITLQLPPGAQDASETNLIEQPLEHRSVANGAVTVHTKPYEIKTVEVRFSAAPQPSGDR